MKRICLSIGVLLMMTAAASCGSAAPVSEPPADPTTAAETASSVSEETTEEGTTPEATTEAAPTIEDSNAEIAEMTAVSEDYSVYAELLDWYHHQISTGWTDYDQDLGDYGPVLDNQFASQGERIVSYLWFHYEKPTVSEAGYQILDIDHDGVDELVVGVISEYDGEVNVIPYDLYTFYDGKPIRLVSCGERDHFSVGDGFVSEGGSAGAAITINTMYHLKDGRLDPYEEYKYDGMEDPDNPYFYSNEPTPAEWGGFEFQNWKHVTEQEFEQSFNIEPFDLHLTSFSEYKPA